MKVIKGILIFLILVNWSCDEEALPETILNQSFVRFSFQVNQNNEVLEFPEQSSRALELSEYTLDKRDTLKIPVIASISNLLKEILTVNFETEFSSEFINTNFDVFPNSNLLQFTEDIPSDTIVVVPKTRFDNNLQESINFKLTSSSNPDFILGYPRETLKLDEFQINIAGTQPINYSLEEVNFNLNGQSGESLTFDVVFDQLVSEVDVENLDFISTEFVQFSCDEGLLSEFQFELTRQPITELKQKMTYTLSLTESAQDFGTTLNIILNEVDNDNFNRKGNNLLSITTADQPIVRSGDPASHWYNISDIFHRTYGKAWYFDSTDQACDWQNYQSFTRPVEVEPGSEFDNGQGFHRYKIGFRNIITNPGGNTIGTNPFNFRRYYDGASVLSPAYNQIESIEFFPENGDNPLQGSVKVISQTLVFILDDTQINVPICGSGTYEFNASENRWEIFLTIVADESEINGNNEVEKQMFIYTENILEDPNNINKDCSVYIEF